MLDTRRIDDREHLLLASYAMHSRDTQGRVFAEPEHSYRGPFARDRDRVLHSSAFRRLAGKMQVFTGEMGIYHRTRLTHTFEVASIARTMARVLRLNEDLTEALALMHDVGHPPYGHCGEDALSECMQQVGGFSHNAFALTLVEQLEQRYAQFPGLNLSHEMLAGQDTRAHKIEASAGRAPLLEVQLVDAADSMAYDAHDVDDALQLGLLSFAELTELAIVRRAMEAVREKHAAERISEERQLLVHELIDLQVTDFLHDSIERLLPLQGQSQSEVRDAGVRLEHSDEIRRERGELEAFLFDAVYRHPRLIPVRRAAYHRLQDMFEVLQHAPARLPLRFCRRLEDRPVATVVGEYLAGMTDSFCDAQYKYATDGSTGPLADW